MLISKYQPHRETVINHTIKSETDLTAYEPLTVACIDKIKVKKQLMVWYNKDERKMLIKKKKNENVIQFNSQVSNFVYISAIKLASFSTSDSKFHIVDLDQGKNIEIPIEYESNIQSICTELFFFKNIQQFCIISHSNNNENTLISYFTYQEGKIQFKNDYLISEPINKVHQVNEDGLILLSKQNQGKIDLHLYCDEGYRCFRAVENLCKGVGTIASVIGYLNSLHIVLMTKNNSEDQLPILIVETRQNFTEFVKVRLPEQKSSKKILTGVIGAYPVNELVLLHTASEKKQQPLFYSPEKEEIIQILNVSFEQNPTISNMMYYPNQIIEWVQLEKKLTSFKVHQIDRVNSLSIMKLLEAIQLIKKESQNQEKVVLLFGAHGTGKSTLRHFLCKQQLEHGQNEGGFPQVKVKKQPVTFYAASPEKDKIISLSKAQSAVIIEVPDCNHQLFFETQVFILMQAIFKNFKKLHIVLTISTEYIEDSPLNEQLMLTALKMVQTSPEQDISSNMSVVLTKIEDQDIVEDFKERIEEISESNQEVGAIYNSISEGQRIYIFQNRQFQKQEGAQLLQKILSASPLQIKEDMHLKIQQKMFGTEKINQTVQLILSEDKFYFDLISKILRFICYLTVEEPHYFDRQYFSQNVFHLGKGIGQINKLNPEIITPLFKLLANFKCFIEKDEQDKNQIVDKMMEQLKQVQNQIAKVVKQEESTYLKSVIQLFFSAIKLPSEYLKIGKVGSYSFVMDHFKSDPLNLFSKYFISAIMKVVQSKQQLKQTPEMIQIAPYLKKKTKKGKGITVTKKVPMSYQEEKNSYLKQNNILETICSLPSNAMKLDLIIEQIISISQKGVNDTNMRETRFYLRQGSRICNFHKQYFEAIAFLLVIPDFYGIDLLLDEMVNKAKQNDSYNKKSLFSKTQSNIIDELLSFSKDWARQNLTKKLIHLKCLSSEVKGTKQFREKEVKYLKKYIGESDKRLESNTSASFFNFENEVFKNMLQRKNDMIKRCINYQNDPKTSKEYEKMQALNWLIETMPLPI